MKYTLNVKDGVVVPKSGGVGVTYAQLVGGKYFTIKVDAKAVPKDPKATRTERHPSNDDRTLAEHSPGARARPSLLKGKTMQRSKFAVLLTAACGLIGLHLSAYAQDAASGKQAFAQCAACHAVNAANGLGPSLQGIVGRKSGVFPGFRYSPALKNAGIAWDDKNLDAFLSDSQKLVPGNVMPFSGVADAKQRADLIAYLKTLK